MKSVYTKDPELIVNYYNYICENYSKKIKPEFPNFDFDEIVNQILETKSANIRSIVTFEILNSLPKSSKRQHDYDDMSAKSGYEFVEEQLKIMKTIPSVLLTSSKKSIICILINHIFKNKNDQWRSDVMKRVLAKELNYENIKNIVELVNETLQKKHKEKMQKKQKNLEEDVEMEKISEIKSIKKPIKISNENRLDYQLQLEMLVECFVEISEIYKHSLSSRTAMALNEKKYLELCDPENRIYLNFYPYEPLLNYYSKFGLSLCEREIEKKRIRNVFKENPASAIHQLLNKYTKYKMPEKKDDKEKNLKVDKTKEIENNVNYFVYFGPPHYSNKIRKETLLHDETKYHLEILGNCIFDVLGKDGKYYDSLNWIERLETLPFSEDKVVIHPMTGLELKERIKQADEKSREKNQLLNFTISYIKDFNISKHFKFSFNKKEKELLNDEQKE